MKKINVIINANNTTTVVNAEEIKFSSCRGLVEQTRAITILRRRKEATGNIFAPSGEEGNWVKMGFYRWNDGYKRPVIFATDKRRICGGEEVAAIAKAVTEHFKEATPAPKPVNPFAEEFSKKGKELFKEEEFWTKLGVAPRFARIISEAYASGERVVKLEEIKGVGPKTAKAAREAFKAAMMG